MKDNLLKFKGCSYSFKEIPYNPTKMQFIFDYIVNLNKLDLEGNLSNSDQRTITLIYGFLSKIDQN